MGTNSSLETNLVNLEMNLITWWGVYIQQTTLIS